MAHVLHLSFGTITCSVLGGTCIAPSFCSSAMQWPSICRLPADSCVRRSLPPASVHRHSLTLCVPRSTSYPPQVEGPKRLSAIASVLQGSCQGGVRPHELLPRLAVTFITAQLKVRRLLTCNGAMLSKP